MQFTTKVSIAKCNVPIDYNSRIMSIGSCFAENMAAKFDYFKFQNTVNPFGIIFNAVSIENLIARAVTKNYFTDNDIFFYNNLYHCFEVHSQLSNVDKIELKIQLNQILDNFYLQLSTATHIIITFGTSWVYQHITSDKIVANCHKIAQNQFNKKILSVVDNQKSIVNIINLVQKINPKCNFVFTISPVRHIKDGFFENNVSKSNLFTAIYNIININDWHINYFESYEIIMDELRDYRFYQPDMLHPNQTAIDYIWLRFLENYIANHNVATMQEICDIQKMMAHQPLNPNSDQNQVFKTKLQQKIKIFTTKNPNIEF